MAPANTNGLEVNYSVTGATPDELRTAADEVAAKFADGAAYDVRLEHVSAVHELEGTGENLRESTKPPSRFTAYVVATVHDGKPGTPARDDDEAVPLAP